jgi:hypothetical protein
MILNHETTETLRFSVRCYKCAEGCIHLEYGNAMFTFTQQQFRVLAEVIGETFRQIQAESESTAKSLEFTESLVM